MKLKKKHFGTQKEKKPEGKKLDMKRELKKAFASPGKGKDVGGRGFV